MQHASKGFRSRGCTSTAMLAQLENDVENCTRSLAGMTANMRDLKECIKGGSKSTTYTRAVYRPNALVGQCLIPSEPDILWLGHLGTETARVRLRRRPPGSDNV